MLGSVIFVSLPLKKCSNVRPKNAKISFLTIGAFLGAAMVTWLCLNTSQRESIRLSIHFVGYTNGIGGGRCGVLMVSNASPLTVVRGRSPTVVWDSTSAPVSFAPTGWSMLDPGQSERLTTESITNGLRWKLVVVGTRLGDDRYGMGPERRFRSWFRHAALGLQHYGLLVSPPDFTDGWVFSSDWISP
jgi:hypothetical protein